MKGSLRERGLTFKDRTAGLVPAGGRTASDSTDEVPLGGVSRVRNEFPHREDVPVATMRNSAFPTSDHPSSMQTNRSFFLASKHASRRQYVFRTFRWSVRFGFPCTLSLLRRRCLREPPFRGFFSKRISPVPAAFRSGNPTPSSRIYNKVRMEHASGFGAIGFPGSVHGRYFTPAGFEVGASCSHAYSGDGPVGSGVSQNTGRTYRPCSLWISSRSAWQKSGLEPNCSKAAFGDSFLPRSKPVFDARLERGNSETPASSRMKSSLSRIFETVSRSPIPFGSVGSSTDALVHAAARFSEILFPSACFSSRMEPSPSTLPRSASLRPVASVAGPTACRVADIAKPEIRPGSPRPGRDRRIL